ncbi:MAG TPA: aminotransferase class V-fold PLP-dependent enzyme [Pirellulaceae bacterium]|nr:aminotransferase class V-fold PLP-dependent enzyme [Pirellulaceae bacterium]
MPLPLAIDGGTPEFPAGPPPWPLPDEEVREALLAAYSDGSWGSYDGPHGQMLVDRLRQVHQVEHAILCSSGTIAVELALRGLKVGSGDEVILAGYDFAGNFRAVEAVGARPVLVDLAAGSWTLDPQGLSAAIGPQTRAVIVSHLHGTLADMPRIVQSAHSAGLRVIEDACQTPGASLAGKIAGSWGDVGIHSFGGSKLLTAGRGGAIVTPHADVAQRIRIYSQRGNEAFPLSELQAAVLIPQLDKLPKRNEQRAAAVARLRARLADMPEIAIPEPPRHDAVPAYYKLGMLYRPSCTADDREVAAQRRERFAAAVRAEGVALDEGFRGFALRSSSRCRLAGSLARSQSAAQGTLLLHHPVLLEGMEVLDRVAAAIRKVSAALHYTAAT